MKKIKILHFADGFVGMFDTVMASEDPLINGRKVKHYIRRGNAGYIHICHWLVPASSPALLIEGFAYISERVFFGKYRAAEKVDYYQADTWDAIAETVKEIQRCTKEIKL